MKARQIQTRYWDDGFISTAQWQSRYVYLYILTCSAINLTGIFQLSDRKISFETGLSNEDVEIGLQELAVHKKVLSYRGWVYVPNSFKNNRYWKSSKVVEAWEIEFSQINSEALSFFEQEMNTTIYRDQRTEIERYHS